MRFDSPAYDKEVPAPETTPDLPRVDADSDDGITSRDAVIVADAAMTSLFQVIRRVAATTAIVLITARTGHGRRRGDQRVHLPRSVGQGADTRPPTPAGPPRMRDRVEDLERASLVEALAAENGNRTRAAKRLSMSRRAVIYKMIKYGLR